MCKFRLIFFATIFQFAPYRWHSEIVLGKSRLSQSSQRYYEFYFLKSNPTLKIQCCL